MTKDIINQLNPTEAIINNLSGIIDAFVDFYGEDEREHITDKFQNMLVLAICSPNELKYRLDQYLTQKKVEITNSFFEKIVSNSEDKHRYSDLLGYRGINSTSGDPIDFYIKYF